MSNQELQQGRVRMDKDPPRQIHVLVSKLQQLRAEKQEFRDEAVRWAEEAGRLKALLHDAQRDADRYRWLRDKAPDTWEVSVEVEAGISECCLASESLDESIDAAMAAEREGHSCPNCLGVHPESCAFGEREGQG